MAIEVVGAVYCPLSAQDPQKRLQQLISETGSRLVLVHTMTRDKLEHVQMFCMNEWASTDDITCDIDVDQLSSINVTPNSMSYVIFTSGSTGMPKAVIIVQRLFDLFIFILMYLIHFLG